MFDIVRKCPDIAHAYLASYAFSFEPRASIPWIGNVAWICELLTLPCCMAVADLSDAGKRIVQDGSVQGDAQFVFVE